MSFAQHSTLKAHTINHTGDCVLPPTTKAGVTHSLGGEGVGVNILGDERHRIALLQ
jgi:hypothetical protein